MRGGLYGGQSKRSEWGHKGTILFVMMYVSSPLSKKSPRGHAGEKRKHQHIINFCSAWLDNSRSTAIANVLYLLHYGESRTKGGGERDATRERTRDKNTTWTYRNSEWGAVRDWERLNMKRKKKCTTQRMRKIGTRSIDGAESVRRKREWNGEREREGNRKDETQ